MQSTEHDSMHLMAQGTRALGARTPCTAVLLVNFRLLRLLWRRAPEGWHDS